MLRLGQARAKVPGRYDQGPDASHTTAKVPGRHDHGPDASHTTAKGALDATTTGLNPAAPPPPGGRRAPRGGLGGTTSPQARGLRGVAPGLASVGEGAGGDQGADGAQGYRQGGE